MTTTAPRPHKASAFRVLGTRPVRPDGLDKVTGRARYGADIVLSGLLHAKVLRSPHPHARIKSIDVSKAAALPGVKAIITGKDFPAVDDKPVTLGEGASSYVRVLTESLMASQKALYVGHAVAAVAATSIHIAEEAANLIRVEYEVLQPVLNLDQALAPNAPLLHAGLATMALSDLFTPKGSTHVKSNVASHLRFDRGDTAKGFAAAAVVVERDFTTEMTHQGYIEPHACTAMWGEEGRITIWESTQGPFTVRSTTAAVLGLPESSVKVVPMEIGGGFGGKLQTYQGPIVALLSRKAGFPVKNVMTRREVLEATAPSSGTKLRCKVGATKEGIITAAELSLTFEAGAFPGSPVVCGAGCGLTPYKIENIAVDGYDVVVNRPKAGAFRAPGAPQAAFAVEQVMDEVAQKLKMDPIVFRLKNAAHEGDREPNGVLLPSIGVQELEEAMQRHAHNTAVLPKATSSKKYGRGVAIGYWFTGMYPASASLHVNPNGTINLITGAVDIGGTRASLAMQAAEALGIGYAEINPMVVDTDTANYTSATAGSRTAMDTGAAVVHAAEELKCEIARRLSKLWEVKPDEVVFENGSFNNLKDGKSMGFQGAASKAVHAGGPLGASGTYNPTRKAPAVAGAIADVEVDTETGKVQVTRFTIFQDVGMAMHPSYVEGQMQGGASQGIGWALTEAYSYNAQGTLANSSLLDYRLPTSLDLPMLEAVMVETGNPFHPFGARGVGEASLVPPMAAVANAVHNAIGVRMLSLPMSPDVVLRALQGKK